MLTLCCQCTDKLPQGQRQSSLCRAQERKEIDDYGENDEYKNRKKHIYKEDWQTVYIVRYHFNEEAKETMQEKINRMLVTEASRQEM